MLAFKTVELTDKETINAYIRKFDSKSCDYSFTNNFIWAKTNHIHFAIVNGFYCLINDNQGDVVYTYPAGNGDLKTVVIALMEDAKERGIPFRLRGILPEGVTLLEDLFPGTFEFTPNRSEFDYIYSVDSLTNLTGKKYQSKRNHIARFKDNPNWVYEEINEQNIEECFEMNKKWCMMNGCIENAGLRHEYCAVQTAFDHFFELKLNGGLIRREGKIVAFSMGEPLSTDTYVVHIEKAFADIQGAYPMINREFLSHNCQAFRYVNREEDTGDEGLRKTKLSYQPEILLEKYTATIKDN
ncbi:DUF2156 domain-containing protein [Acetanaerobacterium elongatum]|uniref:Phosphatidylglycerol lysyltransferase C-terminal domain-containing protein n=1 Tax=Acetanaerobacterium elongatum TaxID=258515 RepID=A0A1G9ZEC6_9FIRM|nr:phosphatidylglycerol lysyltransferase domain-containing protein [Acetanaerobacterium elongatum]SDN18986.1 hypothetical protein SAMN05192585_11316 [Acetanaerobacterium elongatum]